MYRHKIILQLNWLVLIISPLHVLLWCGKQVERVTSILNGIWKVRYTLLVRLLACRYDKKVGLSIILNKRTLGEHLTSPLGIYSGI